MRGGKGRRCSSLCCFTASDPAGHCCFTVSHAFSGQPLKAGGCGTHGASYTKVARPADVVWPTEILQQKEQKRQGKALAWQGSGSGWIAGPAWVVSRKNMRIWGVIKVLDGSSYSLLGRGTWIGRKGHEKYWPVWSERKKGAKTGDCKEEWQRKPQPALIAL